MPEHAGESPATGADVSAPGGDGRTGRRPLSSVGLRRDAHLVGRLRRAGVVGCAALLLGVSVLTNTYDTRESFDRRITSRTPKRIVSIACRQEAVSTGPRPHSLSRLL